MRILNKHGRAFTLAAAALIAAPGLAVACMSPPLDVDVEAPVEAEQDGVAEQYIGLTEAEAMARAVEEDRLFRVVKIDGEGQMITKDYRVGRINAELENGVVTAITIEGEPAP